ncbi:MAG TPA: M48 family metalloprotease [Albitalea sp.]|uniref:M48 family metalloprotease n=1 Tax=Piscinibacter sp. TaxID=1903157 RepID=UPI002ED6A523
MALTLRFTVALAAGLVAVAGHAVPLAYEPTGLAWSAQEVETSATPQALVIAQRAERAQQLGCRRHCERLDRIFTRLVAEARTQTARSQALPWSLTVVQLPDVDALALPGGQVLVSEAFIDSRALTDEALAFVLAHEMAHSILEHERQALTFARMLLAPQVARSVQDMYVEMDFNLSLLKAMEPVMQQGEFEADELGLLLASAAGFAPDRQLGFIEQECAQPAGPTPVVATHPRMAARLAQLRLRLPLARRLAAP